MKSASSTYASWASRPRRCEALRGQGRRDRKGASAVAQHRTATKPNEVVCQGRCHHVRLGNMWVVDSIGHMGADMLIDLRK
jgi:hypothetical protein